MRNKKEIIIVGAGPAGLITAREAAKKGVDVIVIEEDKEIGYPCHCAGLVSLEGLKTIGVSNNEKIIQNKIKGAKFFSPSGFSFIVERNESVACVVDRYFLDNFLATQAVEAGAEVKLNSKVTRVDRRLERVTVISKSESTTGKIMVDAEGQVSRIVKEIGLKPLDQEGILQSIQYDLEGLSIDDQYVELHFGKRKAPGFFIWVIPLSKNVTRIGLGCKGSNPKDLLEDFIRIRFSRQSSPILLSTRAGSIVTSGPIERTFDDRILIVGDAAGQVKATTGGGIVLGGICASIAGDITAESVFQNKYSRTFLKRYEKEWKDKLGKEFKTSLMTRVLLNKLPDKILDKIFKIVIDENLQDILVKEGDMDFQRKIILKILARKSFLKLLPSLISVFSPFRTDFKDYRKR